MQKKIMCELPLSTAYMSWKIKLYTPSKFQLGNNLLK